MKIRALSFVLAILIVFTSASLTAFANNEGKSIVKIDLTATKNLVQNYDGVLAEDDGGIYFKYDLSKTNPSASVIYSDGTSEELSATDFQKIVKSFSSSIEQGSGNKELKVNKKYTSVVTINGVATTLTFSIEENPIKSIEVNVTQTLKEDVDGEFKDGYFVYSLPQNATFVTVNYRDNSKPSETFTIDEAENFLNEEIQIDLGQSANTPLAPGKHTGKAFLKGITCTFIFTIEENVIDSISVKATEDLIEYRNGYFTTDISGNEYFHYDIEATKPEFTITYKDGSTQVFPYSELYLDEKYPVNFYIEQNYENQLKVGSNFATAEYCGKKCEFEFYIIDEPVRNIVVTPTKNLIECTDGFLKQDADNGNKEYFYYDLAKTYPDLRINYKDGTYVIYSYEEAKRFFDLDFEIVTEQNSKNELIIGEHIAKAKFSYYECDFKFNIVESEKIVEELLVSPNQNLIENSNGYYLENGTTSTYFYLEDTVTYNVKIKYSDGTSTSLTNVKNGTYLDGSIFYVSFNQTFENPYKPGKNSAKAYYKNATNEFIVEVDKNNYTALNISGENELILTLSTKDGKNETFVAQDFKAFSADENTLNGFLYTNNNIFIATIYYTFSEESASFSNIVIEIFDGESELISNVLATNKWFNMLAGIEEIAYSASSFTDGWSNILYNRDFSRFNGEIKGETIDDILTIASTSYFYGDKSYEYDEIGFYKTLSVEEAQNIVSAFFDVSSVDFTTSQNYNKTTKSIRVNIIPDIEGILFDSKLEFSNGYFVYDANYISEFSDNEFSVQIVITENGNIVSISFVKGECTNIKTLSAINSQKGVNLSWSDSDNASVYEIYRSTNGDEYIKIASTYVNTYTDSTVSSGNTYTYKIRPFNKYNQGNFSNTKTLCYLAEPKVSVSTSKSSFTVKWNQITGATGYIVYRSEIVNGKWSSWSIINKPKASVSSFVDKNIQIGSIYKYTVRAVNSETKSSYTGTGRIVYLETPTIKVATAKNGINISWNQILGATGYTVYRSEYTSGQWSSWKILLTTGSDLNSYLDFTAVSGKTYRYTVRAVNGSSRSSYIASNSVFYLAEPTVKISNSKNGIYVKWTKCSGAKGYTVYRSEYNSQTQKWSGWKVMGTAKPEKSAWIDKNAVGGTIYRYTVRTVNGKVKSTYTATNGLMRLGEPTVKISNVKTGIYVKWDKIIGATGYRVYRATLNNNSWSSWEFMGTANAKTFGWTDRNVIDGKTYKYTVRSINGKSMSSYTQSSSLIFLSEPTVKISNTSTGIKVSWSTVETATKYTIYRSEYNTQNKKWSSWKVMGNSNPEKYAWIDKNVVSGGIYKYTIRAVNGSSRSSYTATSSLIFLTEPKVTASKSGNNISVKWSNVTGANSYTVYRQKKIDETWSSWEILGTTKQNTLVWTDKNVENGCEYRYTVRAVNGKSRSSYNATKSIAF